MNIRIFILAAISGIVLSFTASAQPKEFKRPSPEAIAEQKARKMDKDLDLTEKQYKKVYRLFLNIEKERSSNPYGMPPGGGMPPMGGGMPGGMPPGGGMMGGGMSGGMPPGGMMGGGMPGGAPPQNFEGGQFPGRPPMGPDKSEEERIEKRLRKILTEQQFDRWDSLRTEEMMRKMME